MTRPSIPLAIAAAADVYGVDPAQVAGRGRHAVLVEARQAACWALRRLTTPDGRPLLSFPEISRGVGGRHHTTAMHAMDRLSLRMGRGDYALAGRLAMVEERLREARERNRLRAVEVTCG
jgi:chromosomal replication initiation ATPase DnaA